MSNEEIKKSIRISMALIEVLEDLRNVIKKSVSEDFGQLLSYYQLSEILGKKIKKQRIEFVFP